MTKLTEKKVKWIVMEKKKGALTTRDIARLQGVSESRVRQLWCEYRKSGQVPALANPGRPRRITTQKEISTVLDAYREYPCNAVTLENILYRHGIKVPHNTIHMILKDHGLAPDDSGKQKRRKWVKYERRHSMSLWHTDWYQIEDDRWRGKSNGS